MRERSCFLQKVQKSPECLRKRCSAVRRGNIRTYVQVSVWGEDASRKAEGEVRV